MDLSSLIPVLIFFLGILSDRAINILSNRYNSYKSALINLYSPLFISVIGISNILIDPGDNLPTIGEINDNQINEINVLIKNNVAYLSQKSFALYLDFVSAYNTEKFNYKKWKGDTTKYETNNFVKCFDIFSSNISLEYFVLRKKLGLRIVDKLKLPNIFNNPNDEEQQK